MKSDYFVKNEEILKLVCDKNIREVQKMILMDLKIDNIYAFKNFHINMSYPKKIVNSTIENEYLEGRKNFRYKKVNIILGANGAGKTSLGKAIWDICSFMDSKVPTFITNRINDKKRDTKISMDFISQKHLLQRIDIEIPKKEDDEKLTAMDIKVCVREVKINATDNYEKCAEKLSEIDLVYGDNYYEELDKIKELAWLFQMNEPQDGYHAENDDIYMQILEKVLKALDPFVEEVRRLTELKNAYVIKVNGREEIMRKDDNNWKLVENSILSSGTKQGIEVAQAIAGILYGGYEFYYCDEKFSYIHTDIEKACLSMMIQSLKKDNQLFFTSHNLDVLDIDLPKHSFTFMKKDVTDEDMPIKCVSAGDFLKRNTDSLRNAVDNDLFNVAPEVDKIYEIMGM